MTFKDYLKGVMAALNPNAASSASAGPVAPSMTAPDNFDQYVFTLPSAQNAVDAVPGWSHAFPPGVGVTAGEAHLYHDDRILWCIEQAGNLEGKTILELGPLEGMHTYMLAQAGAGRIDAVEANTLAYLKCLISKELLRTPNAFFMLGDFVEWLEKNQTVYDLIVASGVLYHSHDPIRLVELLAERSDRFFIWTHYYDDAMRDDYRGKPFSGKVIEREFKGETFGLHERSYHAAWQNSKFCGGPRDTHFWMKRDDILRLIKTLGFNSVTANDMLDHVNGPCFSVFASRA